jgi:Fe-S-cluster-containing hydrogenase component 2
MSWGRSSVVEQLALNQLVQGSNPCALTKFLTNMPVVLNFKICDNSPECDGIAACQTHALFYDYNAKTITYDESKCTGCGSCACCPAGVIHFAKDPAELEKIKEEIAADPRKVTDLFVQRYGGDPKVDPFTLKEAAFEKVIKEYPGKSVVEVLAWDNIECLSKCIPIKELLENFEFVMYRKLMLGNPEHFMTENKLTQLPALLFFDDGKLVGKVEGFYGPDNKAALLAKISEYIAPLKQ